MSAAPASPEARASSEFCYRFARTSIQSTLPLPELVAAASVSGDLLRIRLASAAPAATPPVEWTHVWPGPNGGVSIRGVRTQVGYVLEFPGVAEIALNGDTVLVHTHAGSDETTVRHVLLDQALPRFLSQRGEFILHGAAVVTPAGKTVLLLGHSGQGKSTLSAALAAAGAQLLTDDCMVLWVEEQQVHVLPTYPSLRLWPDSLGVVAADQADQSTPLADYSDKRRVGMPASNDGPKQVDAILMLGDAGPASRTVDVEPLSAQAACMALVTHAFKLDLSDFALATQRMATAAEISRLNPVHTLTYPRDYTVLPQVVEAVCRCADHPRP